ncbi:hypothetical protein ACOSQ2_027210 [Xanthoceras sorbifolium]
MIRARVCAVCTSIKVLLQLSLGFLMIVINSEPIILHSLAIHNFLIGSLCSLLFLFFSSHMLLMF